MFRKKTPPRRLVRLHHRELPQAFEGLWDGRLYSGHYRLEAPKVIVEEETGARSQRLRGDILVPAAKVLFLELMKTDIRPEKIERQAEETLAALSDSYQAHEAGTDPLG